MSRSPPNSLPAVTAAQLLEVDRRAVDRFELALIQMMENAGRALARVARERFLAGATGTGRMVVLAGPGGNGGGVSAPSASGQPGRQAADRGGALRGRTVAHHWEVR